jgi:hypothetical protein
MKSPFLILFIIFNMLTINLVSASDWYDMDSESHIILEQNDAVEVFSDSQSDCDHFCHISSHMVGIVSQLLPHLTVNTATVFLAQNELFTSRTLTPPIQPPIA